MTKTFTENDLVRFLYDELNDREKAALDQSLLTDAKLRQRLDDLRSIMSELDQVSLSPSNRTIHNIQEFSRCYEKQSV